MSDPTQPAAPPAGGAPAPDAQQPAAPAAAAQPPAPAAPKTANPWARRPVAPAAAAPAPAAQPSAEADAAPKPARGKVQVPARIAKELQLTRQQIAELKPVQKELEATRSALGEYAKRELDGLSEAQRAYVMEHAGKDPVRQLKMAAGLRAMSPPPAAPKPPAHSAPPAAPAAKSDGPLDTLQQYERLKAAAPTLAAAFYREHRVEIDAAKKARTTH